MTITMEAEPLIGGEAPATTPETLKLQISQLQGTVDRLECHLLSLRAKPDNIRQEIKKIDKKLVSLGDTEIDRVRGGQKARSERYRALLDDRRYLNEDLFSLAGQSGELRHQLALVGLDLLRVERRSARLEALAAQKKQVDLESKLAQLSLQQKNLTVMRRQKSIKFDEAEAEFEAIRTELGAIEIQVKQGRREVSRWQGRVTFLSDLAKSKFFASLDAPEKWAEVADRLATAEEQEVFRLCFSTTPWAKREETNPWQ